MDTSNDVTKYYIRYQKYYCYLLHSQCEIFFIGFFGRISLIVCFYCFQEEVKDLQQRVSSRIDFGNAYVDRSLVTFYIPSHFNYCLHQWKWDNV